MNEDGGGYDGPANGDGGKRAGKPGGAKGGFDKAVDDEIPF